MPKNLAYAATGGLYVTLTNQVVVYASAERAEPLPLLRLSPSLWSQPMSAAVYTWSPNKL